MKPKILIIALTFGLMTALILTSCDKCGGIYLMDETDKEPNSPETVSFILKDSAGGNNLLIDSTFSAEDLSLVSEYGDTTEVKIIYDRITFPEIFGKHNLGLKTYILEIATDTSTLKIPFTFDQKLFSDCPDEESIITFVYIDKYRSRNLSGPYDKDHTYEIYTCEPK